jgi:catalase
MANTVRGNAATRKVAILAADGVDGASVTAMKEALQFAGALPQVIGSRLGSLTAENGDALWIDHSLLTAHSVLFDAVYVPGGAASVAMLQGDRDAVEFVLEAFRHCKPIAASSEGVELLRACPGVVEERRPARGRRGNGNENGDGAFVGEGVLVAEGPATADFAQTFLAAVGEHRFWNRARKNRLDERAGGDETRGVAPLSPSMTGARP